MGGGGGRSGSPPSPPNNQPMHPSFGNGSPYRNDKQRRFYSKFIRGTGTAHSSELSLAPVKPNYMKNKVFVVHGLDKGVNHAKLQQEINRRANQDIKLLHVAPLSRVKSWCTTLAIELSEGDYDILSQPGFWERQIKIRAWHGYRWYRGAQRPTKEEVRSSMHMQWQQ